MILCVGLTPTVQRTMFFDRFEVGAVNRAREVLTTASGKGANVARVITTLGGTARLIHTLGGDTGRFVAHELEKESVPHQAIWSEDDAPTRTCTTLLVNQGPTTELVEEALPVTPHDAALIDHACRNALLEAHALCLSGSLPRGIDEKFYAGLVREANNLGIPAVVDGQKGPLQHALKERPFLVKPNREEAAATLGLTLTGSPDEDARTAVEALTTAGAQWALVSMGAAGSLLGNGQELWQIAPPHIEVINAIGSGDSLAAGLLFAFIEKQMSVPEAVAFGSAVAAANCLTPTSGVIRPEDVERLRSEVTLSRLR